MMMMMMMMTMMKTMMWTIFSVLNTAVKPHSRIPNLMKTENSQTDNMV